MNYPASLPPFTHAAHINKLLAALLVMQEKGLSFEHSSVQAPYKVAEALVQARDEVFAQATGEVKAIAVILKKYQLPEEADFTKAAEETLYRMAVKGSLMSKNALTEQLLVLLKEGHKQEELPSPDIASRRLSIEPVAEDGNGVLRFLSILCFILGIIGLLTLLPILAFRFL